MKVYSPIGYYNNREDIIDLFPNYAFKGDEADIIVKYQKNGFGAFHTIDGTPDEESYIAPAEASKDKNIVFTSDGQYLVRFTGGSYELLRKGSDMHGFYIDIYKLIDAPGYEYSGLLEETTGEKDITKMQTDDLLDYVNKLAKTTREGIAELKRRGYKF